MVRICLKIVSLQYFVSLLQDLVTNLAKATWRRSIGSKWWRGWRWLAPDIAWWFFIISMLLGLTGGLGSNRAVLPHDLGWVWDCLWCRVCWRSKTLNDWIRIKNLLLSKVSWNNRRSVFPPVNSGCILQDQILLYFIPQKHRSLALDKFCKDDIPSFNVKPEPEVSFITNDRDWGLTYLTAGED